MKYMGSKRTMLGNGLGRLLLEESQRASRFIDLFSGTAAVAQFVAERQPRPVVAVDLQQYSFHLGAAVLHRTRPIKPQPLVESWLQKSINGVDPSRCSSLPETPDDVLKARRRSASAPPSAVITRAYGGYYFSPSQAETIDALLTGLPSRGSSRDLCLAALIEAAASCAAAPGHTAQPFAATASALPHIRTAWGRDPADLARRALLALGVRHALVKGQCKVADAVSVVTKLGPGDLVFLDPPYSAVQYSRFYHVLETIARGSADSVTGVGRYPPPADRPTSEFSKVSTASPALLNLIRAIAARGSTMILTFPQYRASNGVSGEELVEMVKPECWTDITAVPSRLSTLGGNNGTRAARWRSNELIVTLRPKSR
jgi:adenine-specific DNA-methyltransferase